MPEVSTQDVQYDDKLDIRAALLRDPYSDKHAGLGSTHMYMHTPVVRTIDNSTLFSQPRCTQSECSDPA